MELWDWDDLMYVGNISNSCPTNGTRCATIVTDPGINHERRTGWTHGT